METQSKKVVWAARIIVAITGLGLAASAVMKCVQPADFMTNWTNFGYPAHLAVPIAIVELACAVLYLVPQTAFLGTLLVVAYLGGATATHVRVGDPFIAPVLFGVAAVVGCYLRDARLRALLPLRRLG